MWIDDLNANVLDSAHDEPLHRQLSEAIREGISGGALPPGTRMPTEADFQKKFGISRSVVRQAMAALTNDNLIQRGRGRGSVVAPQHEHHRAVQKMSGLSTQFSSSGDSVTTEVLSLERGEDPRAQQALGTSDLLALNRRRSVDGEPIALIHTWLPRRLVPGLEAKDLVDSSLHDTLRQRYGVPVTAGHRQVRAVSASEELSAVLGLHSAAPLLVLEGTSCDDKGEVIEYFCTWHRADRVIFDVDAISDPAGTRVRSTPKQTPTPYGSLDAKSSAEATELSEAARSIAEAMNDLAERMTQQDGESRHSTQNC